MLTDSKKELKMVDETYLNNEKNFRDFFQFLVSVDGDFTPYLSSRIDLNVYAKKLKALASINAFIDDNGDFQAFVAYYLNENSSSAYVTFLSVSPKQRGQGLSKGLLEKCIETCKVKKIKKISLEVSPCNMIAIRLYRSFGFHVLNANKSDYKQKIDMELCF